MKNFILNILNIFKPWFAVDSRALGIYRIVFGLLCLTDILRRWEFIDIFYIIVFENYPITFNLIESFLWVIL